MKKINKIKKKINKKSNQIKVLNYQYNRNPLY